MAIFNNILNYQRVYSKNIWTVVFHDFPCFSQPVLVPHGFPNNYARLGTWNVARAPALTTDVRLAGLEISWNDAVWFKKIGCDVETSLQWIDWCCCWMNADMHLLKNHLFQNTSDSHGFHVISSMARIFQVKLRQATGRQQIFTLHFDSSEPGGAAPGFGAARLRTFEVVR